MNREKSTINLDHIAEQWVNLLFADIEARKKQQKTEIEHRKENNHEVVA